VTPLQKIAMGLLLVLLDVSFKGYDAVPDLAGWILVVLGLIGLRPRLANTDTLLWLAAIAGIVSGALFLPELSGRLQDSTEWLLSLPQLVFSVLLCTAVADLSEHEDRRASARFLLLRWFFVALAVLPVALYGGHVEALVVPLAVLSVAANVYLIVLLFTVSRKAYALT
jgi:hypothetical protein